MTSGHSCLRTTRVVSDQSADRILRWVAEQQVDVVVFAVEGCHGGAVACTDLAGGRLQQLAHPVGDGVASELGYQYHV